MARKKTEEALAVTIEQAGQMLGISRNLAYKMAQIGEIPTVKLGKRRLLVPIAKLEQLLKVD
jgi:excisionase family DNA binding protein